MTQSYDLIVMLVCQKYVSSCEAANDKIKMSDR